MDGLSRQIQQLGKCERPCLIVGCVLFITLVVIAMMMMMMKQEQVLSFGEDYIILNTSVSKPL